MSVIKDITFSQIKKAPQRFLVTVIGVIISAAMLTAVCVSYKSVYELIKIVKLQNSGQYHYRANVNYDERAKRFVTDDIFESWVMQTTEWISGKTQQEKEIFIEKIYGNSTMLENYELSEGTNPTAKDEAVVTKNARNDGFKIGDTINVTLIDNTIRNMKITGFIDVEDRGDSSYFCILYSEPQENEKARIFVSFADITKQSSKHTMSLAEMLWQGDPDFFGILNNDVLEFYNATEQSSSLTKAVYGIAAVAIIIIIVASVLMIYNSFSISTAERRKMLGMLSSIGATPFQKKSFVFYEAALVGAIGIPIGLLCGFIGITVTLHFLSAPIAAFFGAEASKFKIIPDYRIFLMSGAFSALTLFISAYLPSLTAAKISPIEAVRGAKSISYKAQSTKGLTRRLFGFEGRLAEINMKRNRRRYFATLLSLTGAVVILIAALAPSDYLEKAVKAQGGDGVYNVGVSIRSYKNERDLSLVDKYMAAADEGERADHRIIISATANNSAEILSNKALENLDQAIEQFIAYSITAIPNEEFEQLYDISADAENGLSAVLVNSKMIYNNNDRERLKIKNQTKLKQGDSILCELSSGGAPLSMRINKVTDKGLPVMVTVFEPANNVSLIVSQAVADKIIDLMPNDAYIEDAFLFNAINSTALYNKLYQVEVPKTMNKHLMTNESYAQINSMLLIIKVFSLGFVSLIGLVSAANISNTVYTSILLRKRELAMIKSVGLEQSRVNKMVVLEGGIYSLKALLYGLPIGLIIYIIEYQIIKNQIGEAFMLPIGAMLLAAVGVIAITAFASLPALKSIKTTPITELLRTDSE